MYVASVAPLMTTYLFCCVFLCRITGWLHSYFSDISNGLDNVRFLY